ncbi:MAG: DUF2752 domain-containing protein [Bacteroidales bacterium]|nr:DUF2752 domain-containing protein [Bacteroidales bacterium]
MKRVFQFIWANLELFFWIIALIYLFSMNADSTHFTLCPIKNLGFNFCPGCGIGHSLHHIMHLDIRASFSEHPLGIFALIVIILRIFTLVKNLFKTQTYGIKTFTHDTGR